MGTGTTFQPGQGPGRGRLSVKSGTGEKILPRGDLNSCKMGVCLLFFQRCLKKSFFKLKLTVSSVFLGGVKIFSLLSQNFRNRDFLLSVAIFFVFVRFHA